MCASRVLPSAKGGLTLRIQEAPVAVQPNPFRRRRNSHRAAHQCGDIEDEPGINLAEVPDGTTLSEVISGLERARASNRAT